MSKIYTKPMGARALNQQVTNAVGLRLFDRNLFGSGEAGKIRNHGKAYMQFLHRHSPFAIHGRPIDDLPAFLSETASRRNIEGCYTLQEHRKSFPLREALLCVLAETQDLSWAVLINIEDGNIIQASQFTKGTRLSTDAILGLKKGKTILRNLLTQGIIDKDGKIQPKYYENMLSLGFKPSKKIEAQDIGGILRLFERAQWAKKKDEASSKDMISQIANIVPCPKAKSLKEVPRENIFLSSASSIGHPILRHSFYPEQDHEQAWYVFPSMLSPTGISVRANPQVVKKTILMFRRFHELFSEA